MLWSVVCSLLHGPLERTWFRPSVLQRTFCSHQLISTITSIYFLSGYANPPVYTGDATLKQIPKGTFVNSTHFSLTFVCSNCITEDSFTFSTSSTSEVMGWALASTSPTDVTNAGATLTYHSAGFGAFGVQLAQAKSDQYDTWAALATGGDSTTTAGPTAPATATASGTSAPASTTVVAPGPTSTSNKTYDAIVVGGGPAGIIGTHICTLFVRYTLTLL